MARQFFDLVQNEDDDQRDDEIFETLETLHHAIEDIFALVLSLSLATSPARRTAG